MVIQRRGSRGTELIPMETCLMADRKIFLEGDICDETASEFVKKVMLLNSESTKEAIDVLINSNGGEVLSGMLIYDVIQASKAPIRMYCMGKAYSMAALIFVSGTHGRYILPHGKLMLHEPFLASSVSGDADSIKSNLDALLEIRKQTTDVLVKHTGRTRKEIEKDISFDHFYSAEESLQAGLCDEIVNFDKLL